MNFYTPVLNTKQEQMDNDLYLNGHFIRSVSDENGNIIPSSSYSYIYFSDADNEVLSSTKSTGVIRFKSAGLYLIILNIYIYDLKDDEYIDFCWNSNLSRQCRIRGNRNANYTLYTHTECIYLSGARNDICVLFNRTSRSISYAFCSLFVWNLPA